MSTGHTPNPPDQPTVQVGAPGVDQQTTGTTGEQPEPAGAAPLSLNADMARIIEEQADIIAQKQIYHSQMLLGVSAIGTDVGTARTSALIIANAVRQGDPNAISHSLVNLGDPQYSQINDRTLPYRFNAQMAGLLEGIILATLAQAYSGDEARLREARTLLTEIFNSSNEDMMALPKTPPRFQAPAMSPEPMMLAAPESS